MRQRAAQARALLRLSSGLAAAAAGAAHSAAHGATTSASTTTAATGSACVASAVAGRHVSSSSRAASAGAGSASAGGKKLAAARRAARPAAGSAQPAPNTSASTGTSGASTSLKSSAASDSTNSTSQSASSSTSPGLLRARAAALALAHQREAARAASQTSSAAQAQAGAPHQPSSASSPSPSPTSASAAVAAPAPAHKTHGRWTRRRARRASASSPSAAAAPRSSALRMRLLSPSSGAEGFLGGASALHADAEHSASRAALARLAWDAFFAQGRPLLTHGLAPPSASRAPQPQLSTSAGEDASEQQAGTAAGVLLVVEEPGAEPDSHAEAEADAIAQHLDRLLLRGAPESSADALTEAEAASAQPRPAGATFVVRPGEGAFLRRGAPASASASASAGPQAHEAVEEQVLSAAQLAEVQALVQRFLASGAAAGLASALSGGGGSMGAVAGAGALDAEALEQLMAQARVSVRMPSSSEGAAAEPELAVVEVDVDVELLEEADGFGASASASGASESGSSGRTTGAGAAIAQAIEDAMAEFRRFLDAPAHAHPHAQLSATAPRHSKVEGVSQQSFSALLDRLSASSLAGEGSAKPSTKDKSNGNGKDTQALLAAEHRRLVSEAARAREHAAAVAAAEERGEDPALAHKLGAEAELLILGERGGRSGPSQDGAGAGAGANAEHKPSGRFYLGAALGGLGSGFGSIGRPDSRWARGTASWLALKGRPYEAPPAPVPAPEAADVDAHAPTAPADSVDLTAADMQYVHDVLASRGASGSAERADPDDAQLVLSRAMVQNSLPAALRWDAVAAKMDAAVRALRTSSSSAENAAPAPVIDVTKLNARIDPLDGEHVLLDSVKRKRRKKMRKHKYKKLRKEQRAQRQRLKK